MMVQQNYAKFDSRIDGNETITDSISYGGFSTARTEPLASIIDFFGDVLHFILVFLSVLVGVFAFFLCIYIVISLFSRGGEKTLSELKTLSFYFSRLGKHIFGGIISRGSLVFSYFYTRKKISITIIVLCVLFSFGSSVISGKSNILTLSKINSGYVGVDLKNNKILQPGYHLYSPIRTNYFLSPTNNFDFEIVEVTANTQEDLGVTLDYRVGFRLKDDTRLDFYNTYGAKNIKLVSSDVVMPRLLEVIKGIIRDYGFRDISSKHAEIKSITLAQANEVLDPIGIELRDITILDIRLPESYLASKEDLLKSENELKLAEARLEAQKKESEKKIIEAENMKKIKVIEAESIAEYNAIISEKQISKNAIEMKKIELQRFKIEKWDGKMPTHIEGDLNL